MKKSEGLYRPLSIGNLTLKGNLLAAPLAGFSDRAYRDMCVRYGASLTYTEMVSCEALYRGSGKTHDLLKKGDNEDIYAVQLFTGSPENIRAAVEETVKYGPVVIDLNCGCPVPKILKSGSGAALMKDPEKIGSLVSCMKETAGVPVTVKIRSGWDPSSLYYKEAALAAQEAGAALVTLHPRTRSQGYGGRSDWTQIKELKQLLKIPVVGSGDLFTPADAEAMLRETGCDGVMFARGAVGNPLIFRDTVKLLTEGDYPGEPGPEEKLKAALEHLELSFHYFPERYAIKEIRKHLCAYTKGIPYSSPIRASLVKCESLEEYRAVFSQALSDFF